VPTEVIMPQMGFDMKEGKVARWLKKEGEQVTRGEIIAEIETDKAVVEMEATSSGVLRQIAIKEGQTVPVLTVIGIISAPGEEIGPVRPAARVAAAAPQPSAPERAPAPARGEEEGELKASPIARRIAAEHGVEMKLVKGSGPGGRITREDVEAYVKQRGAAPAAAPTAPATHAPAVAPAPEPSRMRQAIARRMAQSKREAPHFYVTMDIDMTAAMRMRSELNEGVQREERISVNDMIVRACAMALKKFPYMNSYYVEDRVQIHEAIHVGIAIALEDGLIAPAILDCQNKSLKEIARASEDLANRGRGGTLRPQEYTGATFTISNLGMYDVDNFVAIINPPQAAILAVGTVKPQPVVRENQIAIAQVMKATLSADHRVTDGAKAAQFLKEVKTLLERPWSLVSLS